MTDADLLLALERELGLRASRTESIPLQRFLYDPPPLRPPSPSLLTKLWAAAPALLRAIRSAAEPGIPRLRFREDPIGHLTVKTVRWLHSHQQFLRVDDREVVALGRHLMITTQRLIAAPSLASMEAVAPAAFDDHTQFLRSMVTRLAGPSPTEAPGSQYSPQLQLRLLGLDPSHLDGRLLDLGCGPQAHLVQYLRQYGVDAWGLDRYADAPGCVTGEWLAIPPSLRQRWRYVTSHQGFSLHFVHHHLQASPESAISYAIAYRAILDDLPTGGLFAYAPGLPFIEGAIDRTRFRVTHPVGGTIRVGDLDLPLATRVLRLPDR
ncbi:hypothetical protein [Calidifontibacter indicus]|uniref:hypothetical protein n=1 Tax=Calidifontibacter indicus TaxID=419650 RepID=UPI003D714EEC